MNIKLRLQRRQSSKTTALNLLSFDFYLISLTHATQCRHITRESVKGIQIELIIKNLMINSIAKLDW